jgi:hypothetical protein
VICPHCQTSLRRRERTDHQCSTCGRRIALDPKDNALGLHDLRLRRLIDSLSDGGRLAYTVEQLWYASARDTLRIDRRNAARRRETSWSLVPRNTWRTGFAGQETVVVDVRMPLPVFQRTVVDRWAEVYGSPPPGMVDSDRVELPAAPDQPVLALLCPDRAVLTCLAANQVPQRLRLAVGDDLTALPPSVPVALLHDVSVAGYRWAVTARSGLIGRQVMDVGPRPATVMQIAGAVRMSGEGPGDGIAALRTAGTLQTPELEWLGDGWWSPIAAVRPAVVIAWVEVAAARVDPDHRAAAAVGFLTWPSSGSQRAV